LTVVFHGWVERVRWVIEHNGDYYPSWTQCNLARPLVLILWSWRKDSPFTLSNLLFQSIEIPIPLWTQIIITIKKHDVMVKKPNFKMVWPRLSENHSLLRNSNSMEVRVSTRLLVNGNQSITLGMNFETDQNFEFSRSGSQ
jgi:hypothetical protein